MKNIRVVSTDNAPAAIGPYSQAVVFGDLVFCSGQIALDPSTGSVVEGGVEAQAKQVFENLSHVLAAAGTNLAHALRLTVYLTSMDDFARVNEVYASYFPGENPPSRATVEVSRLPKEVQVEIDCIAALTG